MLPLFILAIENEEERSIMAKIFEDNYALMKERANQILKNEADAEDAAMDALAYMCDHAEKFLEYPSKKTLSLIFLCNKHKAYDIYRKKSLRNQTFSSCDETDEETDLPLIDLRDPEPLPIETVIRDETNGMMKEALEQLEWKYQVSLKLRYFQEMKNIEIAEMMGVTPNTVNGYIHTGKALLGKKMKELGYVR